MNLSLNDTRSSIRSWLRYNFLTKKLNTPLGYILLGLIAILIAYTSAYVSYKLVFGLIVIFAGAVLAVASVLFPYFGFYWVMILSVLIFTPERLFGLFLPFGIVVEIYTYLTLLGVLTREYGKQQIQREFWRQPITIILIVLLLFYTAEGANPSMYGILGWFNFYRKFISFLAFYLIAYSLLNSKAQVWTFIKFWIIMVTLLALYTIKQQLIGFANWEYYWLIADKDRYDLYFQQGFVRKFAILADPAAAGALFASMSVFLLVLGLRTREAKIKWLLYIASVFNMVASSFTGTRTANLMIIAGILFYCVATIYEKRTIRFFIGAIVGFLLLLFIPVYNPVVIRIRTTFQGSNDPSAALRNFNRARIQPYIYSHPIGGGIYTSLVEGPIYNPGHPLSRFSPDSGYMKIAVEQGPIGLALALIFYYLILRTGVKNFFRTRDPVKRDWYISILCMIFALLVGQYSQVLIGQYPTIFFFYATMAIFIKLAKFENNQPSLNS